MQIRRFKVLQMRYIRWFHILVGNMPWQKNNTFIGISYFQNRIKLLQFAPVCQAAEASVILQKIGLIGRLTSNFPYYSSLLFLRGR